MADSGIRMPSSGGGLINYSDEIKGALEIPPMYVLVAIGVVIVVGIYLHLFV
ncbi:MAG TPA: hypothetical protein VJI68_01135 [Candidatus Nanoarchaeia archaeon]|nr:hypothetical protein [Candidatus Nanoarchaeia archaeon]